MNKWTTSLLIGSGLLVAWTVHALNKKPRTVLVIGNSLTANGGYCALLESRLPEGSSVRCVGFPGQGVRYIRNNVQVSQYNGVTDVVVLAGVNDLASGRSVDYTISELEKLYREAKSHGARVTAVTLTPWGNHKRGKDQIKQTRELNSRIVRSQYKDDVVLTASLGYSDAYLMDPYDSGDGLHLTDLGQERLGHMIYGQVF